MSALKNAIVYSGGGQSGIWTDPLNWTGGHVPGAADSALITKTAAINGPVSVENLMLLGQQNDTITGAITTNSANTCESFMVCDNAQATFAAGASLASAGGFICGLDATGTTTIDGASGGKAAAVLNAVVMKIGEMQGANGTVNDAGVLNISRIGYVGQAGTGTMNVYGSGQANFAHSLFVGLSSGTTAHLNLSGSGVVNVSDCTFIGTCVGGAPGGDGAVAISGSAVLESGNSIVVDDGSSIAMAGGTVQAGNEGSGLILAPGSVLSGFGTITSPTYGVHDNGAITASGGTLAIIGNLTGAGSVQIAAGASLDLNSSRIGVASIGFLGGGSTLQLTTGVTGVSLAGFGVADQIVMNGIDAANWNGTTDVLTLSEQGHVVDRLTLTGVAAGAIFHVAQGGVISMMPAQPVMFLSPHH